MSRIRRIAVAIVYAGLAGATLLGVFEALYRTQIIDFYRPELVAYNRSEDLRAVRDRPTILVFGNSFSTEYWDYPTLISNDLAGWRVINAAVLGSGTREMRLIAPRRFAAFHPKIVIFQLYNGDLFYDHDHPFERERTSLMRSIYWRISDALLFAGFADHRGTLLAFYHRSVQVDDAPPGGSDPSQAAKDIAPFRLDRYDPKEIEVIRTAPRGLEDALTVDPSVRHNLEGTLRNVRAVLAYCQPAKCRAYILPIPHKVQVSDEYLKQYEEMGGQFSAVSALQADEYPFFREFVDAVRDRPNVSVVNILPALKDEEADGCHVYFQDNAHLNSSGQTIVANQLLTKFAQDGLLTPTSTPKAPPCTPHSRDRIDTDP